MFLFTFLIIACALPYSHLIILDNELPKDTIYRPGLNFY